MPIAHKRNVHGASQVEARNLNNVAEKEVFIEKKKQATRNTRGNAQVMIIKLANLTPLSNFYCYLFIFSCSVMPFYALVKKNTALRAKFSSRGCWNWLL